jgi:hypothetical protein
MENVFVVRDGSTFKENVTLAQTIHFGMELIVKVQFQLQIGAWENHILNIITEVAIVWINLFC